MMTFMSHPGTVTQSGDYSPSSCNYWLLIIWVQTAFCSHSLNPTLRWVMHLHWVKPRVCLTDPSAATRLRQRGGASTAKYTLRKLLWLGDISQIPTTIQQCKMTSYRWNDFEFNRFDFCGVHFSSENIDHETFKTWPWGFVGHFYETTFRFPSQKTADASFPCLWTSFCTERLHAPGCPPRGAVALNPFFPDKVPFPAFGLCCCTILLALRSESPRSGFARRPAPASPREVVRKHSCAGSRCHFLPLASQTQRLRPKPRPQPQPHGTPVQRWNPSPWQTQRPLTESQQHLSCVYGSPYARLLY